MITGRINQVCPQQLHMWNLLGTQCTAALAIFKFTINPPNMIFQDESTLSLMLLRNDACTIPIDLGSKPNKNACTG